MKTTTKNNANVANVQVLSKSEAKNAILLKLSKEVSLNKFCKLMQELKATSPVEYKNLLLAYNLSEAFEFTFDWFKENTPQINGKFAYWKKVSEKLPANENKDYNRTTKNGVQYTLVEYNVYKAEYKVFLQMFANTVNEINRLKREKLEVEKSEAKKVSEAKRQMKAKKETLKTMSSEEKLAFFATLSDEEKLAFLG